MLNVRYSSRFRGDFKRCVKRGYDMDLLAQAIDTLKTPAPLPVQNRDHNLAGNYAGCRECHLGPDWLLVYRVKGDELQLVGTGTHADLFGK